MTPDQAKTLIKWIADVIDPNAIAESMEVMDANDDLYHLITSLRDLAKDAEFADNAAHNWAWSIVNRRTIEKSKEVQARKVNRDGWHAGPWDNEPDEEEWVDEATGLRCLVWRDSYDGYLCGYVEVPESLANEKSLQDLECHGGVTFGPGSLRDGVTCIGFDCMHDLDETPKHGKGDYRASYRTWSYVKQNVVNLARQVKEIADKKEVHDGHSSAE